MRTNCSVNSLAAALSTRFIPIIVDLSTFSIPVRKMHTNIIGMASIVRKSPNNVPPIQSRNPSKMEPAHIKKHKKVPNARRTNRRTAPARPCALHSAESLVHAIVTPDSAAAWITIYAENANRYTPSPSAPANRLKKIRYTNPNSCSPILEKQSKHSLPIKLSHFRINPPPLFSLQAYGKGGQKRPAKSGAEPSSTPLTGCFMIDVKCAFPAFRCMPHETLQRYPHPVL